MILVDKMYWYLPPHKIRGILIQKFSPIDSKIAISLRKRWLIAAFLSIVAFVGYPQDPTNDDRTFESKSDKKRTLSPLQLSNVPAQWSAYWSPDNKRITYTDWTTTKEIGKAREWNWDIYVMESDGSDVVNLTNHPAVDIDSHWSPNGKQLCFSSNRDGDFDIYTIDNKGSGLNNITNTPIDEFYPRWSPDGKKIAFLSPQNEKMDIYIFDLKTGSSFNLTNHSANDSDPSWSFSSDKLVFTSDRDGNQEIYEIAVDGTGLKRLTYTTADESAAAYSHDERYIAFNSDRDGLGPKRYGYVQNYLMKSDGTESKRISLVPTGGNAQLNWSRNDDRLLFSSWRGGDRGIYTINKDGTNEQRISPTTICDFMQTTLEQGATTSIDLYDKARLKDPNALFFTGGILERLAFELMDKNRIDEAIQILELYRKEDPESELPQNALLVAYKLKGIDAPPYPQEIVNMILRNFKEGIVSLRKLMDRYPKWYLVSADELLELSKFLSEEDELGNTLVLLELTLEKYPENTKVMHTLSDTHQELGNWSKSLYYLEKILKLQPDNEKVAQRIGVLKSAK